MGDLAACEFGLARHHLEMLGRKLVTRGETFLHGRAHDGVAIRKGKSRDVRGRQCCELRFERGRDLVGELCARRDEDRQCVLGVFRLREKIGLVQRSGETLVALVDDILDVAKIETGKLVIDRTDMDLAKLIDETALLWTERARGKGLALTLDVA